MINEKSLSGSDLAANENEVKRRNLAFLKDKSNWNDEDEDFRHVERSKRLDLITSMYPDFKCPLCRCVVTNLRSWVLSKDQEAAICRKCHFRVKVDENLKKSFHMNKKIFTQVRRYEFNHVAFTECRLRIGLTITQFAELVGWTPSYQCRLENGDYNTISHQTMLNLLKVLGDLDVTTNDVVEEINDD